MPEPDDQPDWATSTNYTTGPHTGTPTKVEPGAGRIAEGHIAEEYPDAREFNWWQGVIGRWVNWFRTLIQNQSDLDPNGLHTGELGGFYQSRSDGGWWRNIDGDDTWEKVEVGTANPLIFTFTNSGATPGNGQMSFIGEQTPSGVTEIRVDDQNKPGNTVTNLAQGVEDGGILLVRNGSGTVAHRYRVDVTDAAGYTVFTVLEYLGGTGSITNGTTYVLHLDSVQPGAESNPLRFTFDADFDAIGDPGAGNFGALDPAYNAPGSPDGWGAIYISQSNVSAANVELLLQKKAVLGGKLTIHDATFTNWFTFDITHVFVHADYIVVEVDDATAEGAGTIAGGTVYEFTFDFAHLPPNAHWLTSFSVTGNGSATSFTPTLSGLSKGDVPFIVVSRFGSDIVLPAGQGWTEHLATDWGSGNTRRTSILAKMWGMPGITDDLTPTFEFEGGEGPEESEFAFVGAVFRGLHRSPTTNSYVVTHTSTGDADAQPSIVVGNPRVDAGGISLRAVVADENASSLKILYDVTDSKAFALSGNAAHHLFDIGADNATADYRTGVWLEGHAVGGRTNPMKVGQETTSGSANYVALVMTFQPKRS